MADQEINLLYKDIKQWLLHWRHPELQRVLDRIEKGRMRPQQAKRWRKKIKPWREAQEKCLNPFGPPPGSQEELGRIDVEVGHLVENPDIRIGIKILDQKGKSVIAAGATGSGKSNLIRRLIYGIDALNQAYDRAHSSTGS
ncbi:MAG TPA: hypothetical protein ENH85_10415 [Candidatus Scalindua sp.]|nr:hypothetical protein [Candidatus Scalindua sp.]